MIHDYAHSHIKLHNLSQMELGNTKVFLVHAMKAYRGNRGIRSPLDRGDMIQPIYPQERMPVSIE
jgi:hypothetical protein